MKVSLPVWLCAVVLGLTTTVVGSAEEVKLAPNFEPFKQVVASEEETDLDATEITLVNQGQCCQGQCSDNACAGGGCGNCCRSCGHVGRDFLVCRERRPGLIGGFEALLIRPYGSSGLIDSRLGNNGGLMNFNPAWRGWVGYQNCDGLGGRVRFFDFDRDTRKGTETASLRFRYADVEMTQAVDFKRWNFLAAGGLRWADTQVIVPNDVIAAIIGSQFNGLGLTFATQATRDLNRTGSLRMAMGARWSALFGTSKGLTPAIAGVAPAGNINIRNDLINVIELNIGPQYRRCLRNGAYLTVAGGLDAQYWTNAVDGTFGLPGSGNDVGFFGFSSSVALTR